MYVSKYVCMHRLSYPYMNDDYSTSVHASSDCLFFFACDE